MELLHEPGEIIAQRYRILDQLGQGGSGTTYQALSLQNDQQVALKALSLHRLTDWKMLELFEREARVLAQLNHPAIPRYLEYFHVDTPQDRSFYIAQQIAEGKSLAALVQNGWHANEQEVRQIAIQILEILVYLHSLTPPVIHRDIKPQNIIRSSDGKIFLVDFGAVQDTYHNTFMRGSTVVGTYGYMAPEQFRGQAVPTTDLYGLGATLLFLLTHRSPAELPTDRLKIDFRSRVQISEDFADCLEKMLDPDVEERFSSAKEALEVLRGKRIIVGKSASSSGWKGLGILLIATVATVSVVNSFKYPILNSLGIVPRGIYEAIGKGDVNTVRNYLEEGFDANSKIPGSTLLLLALRNNEQEVAQLLIAKGADVNAKNKNGETPLHLARSQEMAQLLIAKGADVNAKNKNGETPLHLARSQEMVQLLIAKGADVNAKNKNGETPLRLALRINKQEIAQLLIANGADVNARDNYGETLLNLALLNNKQEIAQLLIANGADVNARDNYGSTLLNLALQSNKQKIAQLLIANGADVNAKDKYGETPLNLALQSNKQKIAQLLIANGADVNAKDKHGKPLLHLALQNNPQKVAQLLIAKGADVNAKDKHGETPLHWALQRYKQEVAQQLIAKGADVNAKDKYGRTPLHLVTSQEVAQLLIAKGADVNAKNKSGSTPLHFALRSGMQEVAQLLIANGTDVNAQDNDGKTPLDLALRYHQQKVAQLLIANGAVVNAQDQYGNIP
ncbi:MAG: ankyrin repeat domain-containing protein [Potamolinea sp.]